MDRVQIRHQILTCTKCHLHAKCSGPVPFSGPLPSRIAIIGEAPGPDEDHYKVPFVGKSGKLLKSVLSETGFDLETITFLNAVSCYPGRTPDKSEIDACRGNFDSQLEGVRAEFILALGNVASGQFRKGRIGEVRGQWWRNSGGEQSYWITATYHPSAVLRSPELEPTFRADIEQFRFFSMGVFDPWVGLCTGCKVGMVEVWMDGEGWCRVCKTIEEPKQSKVQLRKENKKEWGRLF